MCMCAGLVTSPEEADAAADTELHTWGVQARLQLDECQVDALKATHTRLTDQLLNVTSERLHISTLLRV